MGLFNKIFVEMLVDKVDKVGVVFVVDSGFGQSLEEVFVTKKENQMEKQLVVIVVVLVLVMVLVLLLVMLLVMVVVMVVVMVMVVEFEQYLEIETVLNFPKVDLLSVEEE